MHEGITTYAFGHNESVAFLPTDALEAAFSGDGKVGVTYTKSGAIQIWDLAQLTSH
jgi:hypothetical protein